MTATITHRPPNLTSSQAISQHEVIVRQYDTIVKLRAALARMMEQPTMHPLAMTPEQRAELWAAHAESRAALHHADTYLK
jgi:hypothetical protein